MRILIAIAAGTLALSATTPVAADYASREYDRGYRDCLAGQYDREEDSRAYRRGCRAAEREHGSDSAGAEWPRRRPERVVPAGIPNVIGKEPAQALSTMASRGYRNVGTSVAGGMIVGTYFNPVTGECVELANANNRVVAAHPARSSRCR